MKIKTFNRFIMPAIALVTLAGACSKGGGEPEPEPVRDFGTIASLNTVWERRSVEVNIPESYVLTTVHSESEHSYSATLKGTEAAIDHQFPPGSHAIHIYNVANNISVSGMKAKVEAGLVLCRNC